MNARGSSAAVLLFLAVSCGAPSPRVEPARAGDPPPGYAEAVTGRRAEKDRIFSASPQSPLPEGAKRAFTGLDYFPPDPAWRFEGRVVSYPNPRRITIRGSMGEQRLADRWGIFSFEVDGSVQTLQVYRMYDSPSDEEGHFFLPFSDGTTGRETYPAGRYLDPEIGPDGRTVIDFNFAYNPWCAYGKEYDCPITPAENRLDIPVRAGEKGHAGWRADAPGEPATADR